MSIYFDNAATTVVCPEAAQAALEMMTHNYGNPSSTYTLGRQAKRSLDAARADIAAALGAAPGEVFFTSCGSESDNWAILSGAESMKRRGRHVISSMTEHDAVRKSLDALKERGFEVTLLKPNSAGGIDVSDVIPALRDDTVLVTLMMVNNETGQLPTSPVFPVLLKKRDPPPCCTLTLYRVF